MQENRSFHHYFGTLQGVRGVDDPSDAWKQRGWAPGVGPTPAGHTMPFRLDTNSGASLDGECINDPDHSWAGLHAAWNGDRNDGGLPMMGCFTQAADVDSELNRRGIQPSYPPDFAADVAANRLPAVS
jgi:phospholipase C